MRRALGAAGGKLYALIDDCGKNPQLYALNSGTLEKSGSALNVKLVRYPEIFVNPAPRSNIRRLFREENRSKNT